MENQFLVKYISGDKDISWLTEGEVYLAVEDYRDKFIRILFDDQGKKRIHYKWRFDELTFIDIWELKRNGTYALLYIHSPRKRLW